MSFLAELRFEDLQRLRVSVKRIYMQGPYRAEQITDFEADKIIESLGPEAAETLVRRACAAGVVESRRGVVQTWSHD